ncbi:MAG: hypothetical protein HUJ65_05035, partial [Oscillospiraceae bacterium]|nr:hypothetical protein [Oscillospiraceae bacterium]
NVTKIEKLSERRVFAPAWNMELDLNEDIGDRTYIGIHSHDLRGTGDKNVFTCDVAEEVENPFSTVVIVRKSGGGESLAWKINKEAWDSIRAETVSVCLPPESILLLKE